MKKRIGLLCAAVVSGGVVCSAQADIIAGFTLDTSSTGYKPGDFPLDAEYGTGSFTVENFDQTLENGDYYAVDHLSGTSTNRLVDTGATKGMIIRGTSNGAQAIWSVPTLGFEDINVSWAQKGDTDGFNSRVIDYSTDGGISWHNFETQTGSLSGSWEVAVVDFSAIADVDNIAGFQFRITYSGATGDTDKNRWDNFFVQGTAVPEPASLGLLGAGVLALASRRKSRS